MLGRYYRSGTLAQRVTLVGIVVLIKGNRSSHGHSFSCAGFSALPRVDVLFLSGTSEIPKEASQASTAYAVEGFTRGDPCS